MLEKVHRFAQGALGGDNSVLVARFVGRDDFGVGFAAG